MQTKKRLKKSKRLKSLNHLFLGCVCVCMCGGEREKGERKTGKERGERGSGRGGRRGGSVLALENNLSLTKQKRKY